MSDQWSANKGVQIIAEMTTAAVPISEMGLASESVPTRPSSANKGVESLLFFTHQAISLQGPQTELDYQNDPTEEFLSDGSLLGSLQSVLASEFIPKLRTAPTHFIVPLTKIILPYIQQLSRQKKLSSAALRENLSDVLASEVVAAVLFGTDGFLPSPTPLAIWLGCLVCARAKRLDDEWKNLAHSEAAVSDVSECHTANDHVNWFLLFWERMEAVLQPRLSQFELRFVNALKQQKLAEAVAKELDLSWSYCAATIRRLCALARECFEPSVSGVSLT